MGFKIRVRDLLVFIVILTLPMTLINAEPYGPNSITPGASERGNFSTTTKSVNAEAGNITQLAIDSSIITSRWQGYYGNISGTLTLDDASGNTLFDWIGSGSTGFSPEGEIYAMNDTITDWNDVICVNLTGSGTVGLDGINTTILESYFGMGVNDADGIDETFNGTNNLTIGITLLINCPSINTYIDNSTQSVKFNETLVTENATGVFGFVTQIDQDSEGFNGDYWDFQMIVAEDGDVAAISTYNFYVELT